MRNAFLIKRSRWQVRLPGDPLSFPPPAPTPAASEVAKIPPRPSLSPWSGVGMSREVAVAPASAPLTLWTVRAAASRWANWASSWLQKSDSEHAPFSPELLSKHRFSQYLPLRYAESRGAVLSSVPCPQRCLRAAARRSRERGALGGRCCASSSLGAPTGRDGESGEEEEAQEQGGSLLNQPADCSHSGHP